MALSDLYCLVENENTVVYGPVSLPECYKNISNLNNLGETSPELLHDLSWSGNSNQGFWHTTFSELPLTASNQKISSSVSLNIITKTCTVDYRLVALSQEEFAQKAILEKQQIFNNAIEYGYPIPDTSVILKIDNESRIAWNQLLSLLNESLDMGYIDSSFQVQILDKYGVPHTFTAYQIKTILAGLGYYYFQLWGILNSP